MFPKLQLMGQHKIFDLSSWQTSFAALKDEDCDAVYSRVSRHLRLQKPECRIEETVLEIQKVKTRLLPFLAFARPYLVLMRLSRHACISS